MSEEKYTKEKPFMKIPGFRTKTGWKMGIAGFFYALIIMVLVFSSSFDPTPVPGDPDFIGPVQHEINK